MSSFHSFLCSACDFHCRVFQLVIQTRVQWVLGQVLALGELAGSCLSRLQGCSCPGARIHLLVGGAQTNDVLGLLPACWWGQVLGFLNTQAQWS